MAPSRELIGGYLNDADLWESGVYEFGIDTWLLLRTLELQGEIAEVYLVRKPKVAMLVELVELSYVFGQVAKTMLEAIGKNQEQWKKIPSLRPELCAQRGLHLRRRAWQGYRYSGR